MRDTVVYIQGKNDIISETNQMSMQGVFKYSVNSIYNLKNTNLDCLVPRLSVAQSLYGVFPGPLGQFISVTYPRGTVGSKTLSDHVTRNASAAHNNEAQGLGKAQRSSFYPYSMLLSVTQCSYRVNSLTLDCAHQHTLRTVCSYYNGATKSYPVQREPQTAQGGISDSQTPRAIIMVLTNTERLPNTMPARLAERVWCTIFQPRFFTGEKCLRMLCKK